MGEDIDILPDIISSQDVKAGDIQNISLMSSLAAIACYPERIKKLFMEHEINEQGVFSIRLHHNGEK